MFFSKFKKKDILIIEFDLNNFFIDMSIIYLKFNTSIKF